MATRTESCAQCGSPCLESLWTAPLVSPPGLTVPHRTTDACAEETDLLQGMSGTARWTNMCMRTSPRPKGRCWPRRPSTSSCGHHSSQPCSSPSCAAWRLVLRDAWCQGAWALDFADGRSSLCQGRPDKALSSIQQKLIPVLLTNYAVWPLAHIINFRFVPSSQRILYVNFCQVCSLCALLVCSSSGNAAAQCEHTKLLTLNLVACRSCGAPTCRPLRQSRDADAVVTSHVTLKKLFERKMLGCYPPIWANCW